jgi:hypothetical protein
MSFLIFLANADGSISFTTTSVCALLTPDEKRVAAAQVFIIGQLEKWNGSKMRGTSRLGKLCQMTRIKEQPNCTNWPHTRTVPRPRTTGKKITRPPTSIPNKQWSMPIKLSSGRKKLIGSP